QVLRVEVGAREDRGQRTARRARRAHGGQLDEHRRVRHELPRAVEGRRIAAERASGVQHVLSSVTMAACYYPLADCRNRPPRSGVPPTSDQPCTTFDPDLSAFVITEKAETSFAHSAGAQMVSDVAVFRNVRDAAGDFKASAKPGFLRCLRNVLLQSFKQAHLRARITSSRMSTTPRVGAQSVSYRVISTIYPTNGVPHFSMYSDALALRRG